MSLGKQVQFDVNCVNLNVIEDFSKIKELVTRDIQKKLGSQQFEEVI